MTVYILIIVLLLVLGIFALLIYRYENTSQLVYRVSQIVPYPAAKVDGRYISYGDYLFELRPLQHYVQNVSANEEQGGQPIDFNSEEGKQRLDELKQLAMAEARHKATVAVLAKQNNLKVEGSELNDAVQAEISNQGGEDKFVEAVEFYYGWSLDDFRRVVKSKLLEEKLKPVYSEEQRKKA